MAGVRKTVTAVFCDVTGSTALGQRLDPEALRGLMEAHFAIVSAALVRHGGTVEKFVGDAVMAVFGVPVAHEDDALRACRAAQEVLSAMEGGVEFAQPVALTVRVGVETGEVVVGEPGRGSTFASGAAVNLAARLEQAALPGECLIGPGCFRLVRDLVQVEVKDGLSLKGFPDTVTAYRLRAVNKADRPVSDRPAAPLVGRARELALLGQAFDRAANDRTCQLVTVLGQAGAGKSRLAAEFLAGLVGEGAQGTSGSEVTVLRGRCLSYGEGVTYWPLVEVVRQAAGLTGAETEEQARGRLTALLHGDPDARQVAELVAPVAGLGGAPGAVEDTAWAVRRLLEALAADRPVVLMVDDLHWAEPGLREVIDGVSDWSRDAPILLLVLARPELLDDVPDWGAGKTNAMAALLEPLRDTEVDTLTSSLLPSRQLTAGLVARIRQAAGGNPLFVEQLLAMLGESQQLDDEEIADLEIPPTIVALLTARLDRLSPVERAVVGAASVIGQTFYPAAVIELSLQSADEVAAALRTLMRKGLVRPRRSDLPGQEALRFDHVLVRDAAYNALTKQARAVLHERFAGWLDKHTEGRAYDDFIGSHLEAAYRNRDELGLLDDAARRLGKEAALRLVAAGRLLLDTDAAVALLTRALALHPDEGPDRWSIQWDLVEALLRNAPLAAAEIAESIRAAAVAVEDLKWTTRARLALASARQNTNPQGSTQPLAQEAERALMVFDRLGDELGLGWAHLCLRDVANMTGRVDVMATESQLAAEHLTRAGRTRLAQRTLGGALFAMINGAQAASLGLVEARRRAEAAEGGRVSWMVTWLAVSFFATLLGDADEEQQAREQAERLRVELGTADATETVAGVMGRAALACGRSAEAVEFFARQCDVLEEVGASSYLSTAAAYHAHAVLYNGDHRLARRQVNRAIETGSSDDILTQGLACSALAWLAAADGEDPTTVYQHITDALAALEPTELILDRALVQVACAEAARLLGDERTSRHHRQCAIDLYDAKENVVGAEVQRALL
jgi:class 3 adenylate cyclase